MWMQNMILKNSPGTLGKETGEFSRFIFHLFTETLSRFQNHSGNALTMMKHIIRFVF